MKARRYIFAEVLIAFLLALALYVSLFLLQALLARSQYLAAIVASGALNWLIYQIPAATVQAFPLALVLAILMAIGRLAREREILALQACGVSLLSVCRPLIVFAGFLAAAGLAVSEWVVPRANELVAASWWNAVDGGGHALAFLSGRTIIVGQYQIFFAGYDDKTDELRQVRLESWENQNQTVWLAEKAKIRNEKNAAVIELKRYKGFTIDFTKLPTETIEEAIPFANVGPDNDSPLEIELEQTREGIIARNTEGGFDSPRSLSSLLKEWQKPDAALELAMKTAVPLASLAILLLVIRVAALARSLGAAFGLAFLITIGYYLLLYLGRLLGGQNILPPLLGPWLANFAFLIAGFIAIRRGH